ncbi:tetratricopeptide repeat protein [candidate division WOR-3 bacterium]|uniref:Tetratricopeptide repeat protein n=1 Tax=candidate division WOR-3 bacterium TaxID=2052148 RepID=A0A937XFP7_UNCW3|nr:tetratricopeptide repeat protein [candidate division WOR-3 bacterium]
MRAKSVDRRPAADNRKSPVPGRQAPDRLWFLIITGAAFLLRLIHILQVRQNDPLFLSPQMDALYHHEWALAVAAGKQFIADAYFRAPLYPYFLGLLYKILGANLLAVRIVQALIGSAGCGLVYLLAGQLLKPQASSPKPQASPKSGLHPSSLIPHPSGAVPVVAGLVMAVYPLAIWYDSELMLEGMLTFVVLLGFVLLLRSRDADRQWWLPGLVFGLAAIIRPNLLAFIAVLPVWLFLEGKGFKGPRVQGFEGSAGTPGPLNPRTLRCVLLVWGAAALVILPVTIRNYIVSRQFVPIAWQAGTNFVIGNNPNSDGVSAIVPGTRGSWWGGYDDVKRLAEEALGRQLKGAEIDRYWMAKGFEFWRQQPGKALGLLLRKTFLWFAGFEVGNETDLYAVKRYSFINYLFFNSRFLKFPFGILLPLALAGVWLMRREWRRFLPLYLFFGAYSLSFIFFFVTSRYRTPMVPLVAILAAAGITGLIRPIRGRGIAAIIAVVGFLLLNANVGVAGRVSSPDQSHFATALGLHQQKRDDEALRELRIALRYDSATNVLSFEATLLQRMGDVTGAERSARAATRLYPNDADAWGTLGYVFATTNRLDSAVRYYDVALQVNPYSLQAWVSRGNVALNTRKFAEARHYYEGALKVRPTHAEAIFYLGMCDYYEGRKAEAQARWQQALRLDPALARAKQALDQLK